MERIHLMTEKSINEWLKNKKLEIGIYKKSIKDSSRNFT